MPHDVLQLKGRTTFIVGSGKNAGKTTFLNYALKKLRINALPIFTSIGVDGERTDQIFGTAKPRILTEKGDYVVTTDLALKHADISYEICDVFPFQTVMGRPVMARVLTSGHVELIGPENNAQMAEILNRVRETGRSETVLIDGAVNRITQVAAFGDAQFVYVVRVDKSRMTGMIDAIRLIAALKDIPVKPSALNSEGTVEIDGALTKEKVTSLLKDVRNVVIDDFTKVFLSWRELTALQKRVDLYCRSRFHLAFIVVNLFDVDRREFLNALADDKLNELIVFNPYEEGYSN